MSDHLELRAFRVVLVDGTEHVLLAHHVDKLDGLTAFITRTASNAVGFAADSVCVYSRQIRSIAEIEFAAAA
jgi:hypothetical protein